MRPLSTRLLLTFDGLEDLSSRKIDGSATLAVAKDTSSRNVRNVFNMKRDPFRFRGWLIKSMLGFLLECMTGFHSRVARIQCQA